MLKNIAGDWASGLNDGDYACALAALRVLNLGGPNSIGRVPTPQPPTRTHREGNEEVI